MASRVVMSKDSSKDQKDKRGRNPLGITTGNPRTTLKAAAASVAGAKKVVFSEEQKALQKSSFNSGADVQRLKDQLPDVWQRGDEEMPEEPEEATDLLIVQGPIFHIGPYRSLTGPLFCSDPPARDRCAAI